MKLVAVMTLTTLLGACGKKDDKGTPTPPTEAPPVASGTAAFDAWVQKDAAALWQGAWISSMSKIQGSKTTWKGMFTPVAIDVKGDKATVSDGSVDVSMELAMTAPCIAQFTEAITEGSMKGGKSMHDTLFVVQGGALQIATGAAGYRKGKAAIVCALGSQGGVTLVDDKGGCDTWADKFGKLEQKAQTCTWTQVDGKDVLTVGTDDFAPKLVAEGDVLASQQFRDEVKSGDTAKAKDFAEAKALVTAKIKAADPVEKAKAAGGVVGNTDTVVSLVATIGSDKSAVGKPIEVKGAYHRLQANSSNEGPPIHHVYLREGEQQDFELDCIVGETAPKKTDDIKQGTPIVARGTLAIDPFGNPELQGCTFAKAP